MASSGEGEGVVRIPPGWVQAVVNRHYGSFPTFVMEKDVEKSDVKPCQNRLIIPTASVVKNLMPVLHGHEKALANLDKPLGRIKKVKGGGVSKKAAGRRHDGLRVELFDREGRRSFAVRLVKWDSAGVVLKGGDAAVKKDPRAIAAKFTDGGRENVEVFANILRLIEREEGDLFQVSDWMKFVRMNNLQAGDKVEMWAFRCKKHEQLCFVLGKKQQF